MPRKDRAVQIATVTQDGIQDPSRQKVTEETLERLEAAASCRPDIICLPECFTGPEAESVPGPMTQRLGEWARAKSAYVVCAIRTRRDGRMYNSAVLIDRAGKVVGQYDKINPTEGEMKDGVTPGHNTPVFTTDFGKIGFQICFDANWGENWTRLKQGGAEIIFWPSAYPAHRLLAARACLNECYVASSTLSRASRIYDITGEVMSQSGAYQPWTQATVHLGKRLFEIDYELGTIRKIERKYGHRVLIQWYHDEDWFTLTSVDPDLATEDIIAEFAMVPLQPYHARCERAADAARRAAGAFRPAAGE